MWRPKFKSVVARTGGSPLEHVGNLGSKLNVNEEYKEALRTKSYIEIWKKVHGQMAGTSTSDESPSSSSPLPSYTHLSDYVLEPQQETLIDMIENIKIHHLLIEYFEGSLEAFRICGFLLQRIDQTRANYCIIQRVIRTTKRVPNCRDYTEEQCCTIFRDLASFARVDNPLSLTTSPVQFGLLHDRYGLMLEHLSLTRKRIARRAKLIDLSKKIAGLSLVVACSALTVVTVILAVHTMVGVAAAPGLVACSVTFFMQKMKAVQGRFKTSLLSKLGSQLDAAAKGVYILNRDFDTMSRLVMRLHDEIEHSKAIAKMCVRNKKRQMLKEVVREFQMEESCFLEQLEELEEHVYLCVLTINRVRRLVIQEIMVDDHPPES